MLVERVGNDHQAKTRSGFFHIHNTTIRRATQTNETLFRDALKWVFEHVIVIEALSHYLSDSIEYTAFSELFEFIPTGEDQPEYMFRFKANDGINSMECVPKSTERHIDYVYL